MLKKNKFQKKQYKGSAHKSKYNMFSFSTKYIREPHIKILSLK